MLQSTLLATGVSIGCCGLSAIANPLPSSAETIDTIGQITTNISVPSKSNNLAQVTSPQVNPPQEPEPLPDRPLEIPTPDQLLPGEPAEPTEPTEPADIPEVPGTIVVTGFEVVGSTVFTAEQLAAVTQPFTDREITFAELLQARSAITQLYIDNGYITTGAFIPPQTLSDGIVEIRVVEGSLEDIVITGTRRLNPNYVRSRLAIATEKPVNRDRLLEALQLLQLDPLIESLSAELSAGTQPGENLLSVEVVEADSFDVNLLADNRRSPSVGSFRRQIELLERNLFGQGDAISFAFTNTDGSGLIDFSYTYPINPRNGTLTFAYSRNNSRVVEEPFSPLDIVANSDYYDFTWRQPLLQTPVKEFAIGATASHRQSQASILGIANSLSPGAGLDGRTEVTALRLFQEYTKRSNRDVLAFRSQFSLGSAPFAVTANDEPEDQFFLAWRGQGQYVNLLAPDTLFILRADLQLSDRALVPIEQFGIGGQDSVRGYRQDLLLTDNGLVASAEVRLPIMRIPEVEGLMQLTPFIDFGTGWNNSGRRNPDPNALLGLGLGLRWQQGDYLTFRLDYGFDLTDANTESNNLQENGLYFSLRWTAF
ncbi:surface antigen (D15) [Thalassoporum mexicanum PCC 7367]|uniref:ShlB/FhaC/HecB family hemolysin secretion/activation protein n=1 Tax=Thalassoporum mexicanum TaxID=3457544 RepID=UPI00029FBA30|nr:ShlB/FhaC/HecB family hemolysin secretion/activation protein [Pseudanabaena sp. PCC 7367]AFY69256.1 surface antigen (D15) [Pseudanabaena sp. PCC 7367]